ncbi:MAG: S-layer homology domain-containing protein, partial [Clostridia bacterium]|nr:S-layer homology domain-containing protein [Clostridia bacterium]
IYEDSKVTFVAKADTGYRVKEWTIDGSIITDASGETNIASSVTLAASEVDGKVITVQFELGDPIITFVDPANAEIKAETAGVEISSGATVKGDVTFTVSNIEENYVLEGWKVNDILVEENGETFKENIFVYENNGQNANIEVIIEKKEIVITVKATVGGTAEISGDSIIRHGDDVTLKATAHDGYEFEAWYKNNIKIEDSTAEYVINVIESATYEAKFIPTANNIIKFSVSGENAATISAKVNNQAINSGDAVIGGVKAEFIVKVEDGYRVKEWQNLPSNGYSISEDKLTLTIDSLGGSLNVIAVIEAIPVYNITLNATPSNGGNVKVLVGNEEVTSVREGTKVTFTATANPNWMFKTWSGDVTAKESETTFIVNSDIIVDAVFVEAVNYKVKYYAEGESGDILATTNGIIIAKNTEAQIVGGSKIEFTAIPNSGKMVKEWKVNDVVVENNLSNTLVVEYLSENITVVVVYEDEVLYSIPTSTSDYEITNVVKTPDCYGNDNQIRKNGEVSFKIEPAQNKVITNLEIVPSGDNVELIKNTDGTYNVKIAKVSEDIVLTPTVLSGAEVTINCGANGIVTVKCSGDIITTGATVVSGDTIIVNAKANYGYGIDKITVNGVNSNGNYTVLSTDTELIIDVTFKMVYTGGGSSGGSFGGSQVVREYEITVKQNEGGKISPETVKVERGENKTFKVTVDEGYTLKDILVDGKSIGKLEKYTFENVKEKHTIEAIYEKEEWKNPFTDVNENDWYYDAVKFVNNKKLFTGTSNTEFSPNTLTTRGMVITVISRIEGEIEDATLTFNDVDKNAYYAKPIAWGYENEIVKGISDTNYA